jgi:hypothetical protein
MASGFVMVAVVADCRDCCAGSLTLLKSSMVSIQVHAVVVGVVWLPMRNLRCVSKTKMGVWFRAYVNPIKDKDNLNLG